MNEKLSRRTLLQVSMATGIGAAAFAASAGPGHPFVNPADRNAVPTDRPEDLLLRYGGELGGSKGRHSDG